MQIIILYTENGIRLPSELSKPDVKVFQSTTLTRQEISNIIHCCINSIGALELNRELLKACENALELFDDTDIEEHDLDNGFGMPCTDNCVLCQLRNVIKKASQ